MGNIMADTTITKIDSTHSPKGAAGQKYLACGKSMSMRLWENEKADKDKGETKHDYETVGFVIKGKAELHLEGQMVILNEGDSWVVPKGASHHYKILEEFSAIESTSPPAELHDRAKSDNAPGAKEFFEAAAHDAEAVKAPAPAEGTSDEKKVEAKTEVEGEKEVPPPEDKNEMKAEKKDGAQAKEKCDKEDNASCEPKAENKAESKEKCEDKKDDKKDDNGGQVCDPVTKECHPGKEDGAEGKKEEDKNPDKEKSAENQAEKMQEACASLPRTDSEPTSNSEEKEPKPAEHIDVAPKAEK